MERDVSIVEGLQASWVRCGHPQTGQSIARSYSHELELWLAWRIVESAPPAAPTVVLGRSAALAELDEPERLPMADWLRLRFSPSTLLAVPGGSELLRPFYASPHVVLHPDPASLAMMREACRRLREEEHLRAPGWRVARLTCLLELLVQLARVSPCGSESASEPADERIYELLDHILAHLSSELSVPELARRYGMGRTRFFSAFRQATGHSPTQYIQLLRMERAMQQLRATDRSITEIAYACGYSSHSYFNKHFKAHTGLSPRRYRATAESGAGEREQARHA